MSAISKVGIAAGQVQGLTEPSRDTMDPQLRMAALNLQQVALFDAQLQDQISQQELSNERATRLTELRRQANEWKKALTDSTASLKDTDLYKNAMKPLNDDKAARATSQTLIDQIDGYLNLGKPASSITLNGKNAALQAVLNYVNYLDRPDGPTPAAGLAEYLGRQAQLRGDDVTATFCDGIIKGTKTIDDIQSSMLFGKEMKQAFAMLLSPDLKDQVKAQLGSLRAEAQAVLDKPAPAQDSFSAIAEQWRTLARENPNLKLVPAFADKIAKGDLKMADVENMATDLDNAFRAETQRSQEVQLEVTRLQNLIKTKSDEFFSLTKSDQDIKQRILR